MHADHVLVSRSAPGRLFSRESIWPNDYIFKPEYRRSFFQGLHQFFACSQFLEVFFRFYQGLVCLTSILVHLDTIAMAWKCSNCGNWDGTGNGSCACGWKIGGRLRESIETIENLQKCWRL